MIFMKKNDEEQAPALTTLNFHNFPSSSHSSNPKVKNIEQREDMDVTKTRSADSSSKSEKKPGRMNCETGNKDLWAQILKRGEEIYRQASDAQRRDFSLDEIKHVEFLASSILLEVRGMIASDPKNGPIPAPSSSSSSSSLPSSSSSNSVSTASQSGDVPANADLSEEGVLKKRRGRPPIKKPLCCQQCGTTETPEWRRGEGGPNTLCNGCGLRWAKRMKMREEAQNNEGKRMSQSKQTRPPKQSTKSKPPKQSQSPETSPMLRPKTEPDESQATFSHYMRNFAHSNHDDHLGESNEVMLPVSEQHPQGMWGSPLLLSPSANAPQSPLRSSSSFNSTPPLSPPSPATFGSNNPHPSPNSHIHLVTEMGQFHSKEASLNTLPLKVQIPGTPYSSIHTPTFSTLHNSGGFQYSPYPVHISPLPQTPSNGSYNMPPPFHPRGSNNFMYNSAGSYSPVPTHTPSPSAPPTHTSLQSALMATMNAALEHSSELNISYPPGRQAHPQRQPPPSPVQQQQQQQQAPPPSPQQTAASPPTPPPKTTQKQQTRKNTQNRQKLKQQPPQPQPQQPPQPPQTTQQSQPQNQQAHQEHEEHQEQQNEHKSEHPFHQQQVLHMLQNPHLFPFQPSEQEAFMQQHPMPQQQFMYHQMQQYNQIPPYIQEYMLQQQMQQPQIYNQIQLQQMQQQHREQQQQQQQQQQP